MSTIIATGIVAAMTIFSGGMTTGTITIDQLPIACIQATDGCSNSCFRAVSDNSWACTKMACAVQQDAVCTKTDIAKLPTMCTADYTPVCGVDGVTYGNACMAQWAEIAHKGECKESSVACTLEYAPVCANVQVQCIMAPCFPVQETFSNRCMAEAAGAEVIFEWDCNIAQWWVPEEATPSDMITWAYDLGITKYQSTTMFMYDSPVTREQAAKMIMATIDASWVEKWMLKQEAWSCVWTDADQIDVSLINQVNASCAKWLFHGFNDNFMPKAYFTDTDAMTVMTRIAQYVPALADIMSRSRYAATTNTALTRGQFIISLHQLYQQIAVELVEDDVNSNVLEGSYHLVSYNKTAITHTGIILGFDTDGLHAQFCNILNASYTIDADMMNVWPMMSTMMYCDDAQLMDLESRFGSLTGVVYAQGESGFVMTNTSGDVWTWSTN